MNNDHSSVAIYRRRLPHLFVKDYPVFVTWRLHFTLPKYVLISLQAQKDELDRKCEKLSEEYKRMQKYQHDKKQFAWFDELMITDPDFPTLLKEDHLARIVMDALRYFDTKRYHLHAYTIMPNHVHSLLTPVCKDADIKGVASKITYSIKRFTANRINKEIGTNGHVWSSENYDHLVRNESEFFRIVSYILQNPVKANYVCHSPIFKKGVLLVG